MMLCKENYPLATGFSEETRSALIHEAGTDALNLVTHRLNTCSTKCSVE